MSEYKDCYIAFLDILGFKNFVEHASCEDILKIFDEIQHQYIVRINETDKPLMDYQKIHKKIMSDSICIYVETSVLNSLAGIISVCDYFQVRMLRLEQPILVRGAIVRGKIYAEDDITFGPGLSSAYLLEEKTAIFPRIILTGTIINDCNSSDSEGLNYINDYTYRDSDAFYAVDYLYLFYGLSHDQKSWKDFMKYVYRILDTEVDKSIRDKYLYIEQSVPRAIKKYTQFIKDNPNT